MKFSIQTQDFVTGLSVAAKAIPARAAKQVLEAVQIVAEGDSIIVTGSDGTSSITWEGRATVDEKGTVLLPGKILAELARKLPGGEMSLSADSKAASIQCRKSRSKLSVIAGTYPESAGGGDGYTFAMPQNALKRMVGRCGYCISQDEARLILTGALMEFSATGVSMVALDGFRLSIDRYAGNYILPEGKESVKAIVPGKMLGEVARFCQDSDGDCVIEISDGRVRFCLNDIEVISTLLAGEFVDYRRLIPDTFKTDTLIRSGDTQEAVARAELMAKAGNSNLIKLGFSGNTMRVSSMAEVGDICEELDVSKNGDDLEIAFNAKYLTELFRNIDEDEVCLKMNGPTSPCVITPVEGGDWLQLLLPVRVH